MMYLEEKIVYILWRLSVSKIFLQRGVSFESLYDNKVFEQKEIKKFIDTIKNIDNRIDVFWDEDMVNPIIKSTDSKKINNFLEYYIELFLEDKLEAGNKSFYNSKQQKELMIEKEFKKYCNKKNKKCTLFYEHDIDSTFLYLHTLLMLEKQQYIIIKSLRMMKNPEFNKTHLSVDVFIKEGVLTQFKYDI